LSLIVQIENVLFRVPKALFEQSETFSDMFRLPSPRKVIVDGSDDEHPLYLEGYLASDLRQLLRVTVLPLRVTQERFL
jgi:hypothetical protein